MSEPIRHPDEGLCLAVVPPVSEILYAAPIPPQPEHHVEVLSHVLWGVACSTCGWASWDYTLDEVKRLAEQHRKTAHLLEEDNQRGKRPTQIPWHGFRNSE